MSLSIAKSAVATKGAQPRLKIGEMFKTDSFELSTANLTESGPAFIVPASAFCSADIRGVL